MKVEIWSDIVCPFCYIGKRHFEKALENFAHKDKIDIIWHSFQLDPEGQPVPGQSVYEYLAKRKNVSLKESRDMHNYMADMARKAGLEYNFEKAVPNNTMNGHRLSHLALEKGVQNEVEEKLFHAYYTEGKNLNEPETLVQIGEDAGLKADEIRQMLQSDKFKDAVRADQQEAQQLGVRGVPFFVFNRKYAVSGAQPPEVFLETLQRAWQEFEKENSTPKFDITGGDTCGVDGIC
ncbi:MAG: DsbA family oxidoreductase [Hymenobacteraceae bacterium]|nr:DsbA family oxidoreductase [Hymenobacteraceae bacterium]MDX5395243.1 DsbA family oxidoreductase [Hymenobacteraceae bacterium]MDX5511281.1 DsbA family oxidoreductase [Hymenobacteraceae bacterium]